METVSQFDYQGMLNDPAMMNSLYQFNPFVAKNPYGEKKTEEKGGLHAEEEPAKAKEEGSPSETEEKETANKGVSKKTEKEAEYKEAEYISESEDTIQVEKTRPEKAERTSSQTKKPAHSERTSHSRKHKNIVNLCQKTSCFHILVDIMIFKGLT